MADKTKKDGRPKMTLYQYPQYRSFSCVWLIHELGIADDVELVKLNSLIKDTEEYKEFVRSVHPHGTIPALVIEGKGVIIETTAICLYLADTYGKLGPPVDRKKDFYDWTAYSGLTIDQMLQTIYHSEDEELVKKTIAKSHICLERLEQTLQDRQYVCGDSLTVPDCILGFLVSLLIKKAVSPVKDYPRVRAYIGRLENRPAFKTAVKAEE